MKKIISILMVCVLIFSCFSITAFAIETPLKSGDFYYTVLPDGTAEIVGYKGLSGYLTIPPIIDDYIVTSIGREAFAYNLHVAPLAGDIAQTKDSLYVSVVEVEIPPTVTNIGESAFFYCQNLTKITIPSSVETIGSNAFDGTPWLESKPDGCVYINNVLYCYKGEMPESTHIDIKDGTTQICGFAFDSYKNLSSIKIPDSVTDIGRFAFYSCSNLERVMIPDSVKSIGEYAFYGCKNITQLKLSSSLIEISASTFESCESLTEVVIPDSVTKISPGAFSYCKNLSSITIPSSAKKIYSGAFDGTKWYSNQPNGYIYINNILYDYKGKVPQDTEIVIKEGTTEICGNAFENQRNIIGVKIPASVSIIGAGAFRYCDNLKSVRIEDSVKSLGVYAFSQGITIYGTSGSAAEEYSKTPRFEVTFILIGDVDKDGDVSITDATEIQREIANLSETKDLNVSDYNGDGDVTIIDVTLIQRKLAQLD